MDVPAGAPASRNIVDRRAVARRAGWLAVLLAAFGVGRVTAGSSDPDADLVHLTSTALDRAQDHWHRVIGARWHDARVVLIDRREATPCGPADSESGPFYCPANEKIYLDLSFLRAIHGDLARAYVLAHEIGHHVQHIIGDRPGVSSVEIELEADCYAGSWVRDELEHGVLSIADADVDGALAEASAVGDDRICPTCSPETWTHGAGVQRVAAMIRGVNGEPCR